jgi:hypothetical protein
MAFLPQCLRECAPDGPNRPPGRAHQPLGLHMAMDRVGPNPLTLLEREQGGTG